MSIAPQLEEPLSAVTSTELEQAWLYAATAPDATAPIDTSSLIISYAGASEEVADGDTAIEARRQLELAIRRVLDGSATTPVEPEQGLSCGTKANADAIPVKNRIKEMLAESRLQPSENGMESPITTGIRGLLEAYGAVAVSVLEEHWRVLAKIYPDDFGAMLIQLGRSEHEPTRQVRRELIEQALAHPDAGTRDAATLGLDALDDPASEPALRKAARTEKVPPIKTMLEEMLRDISQSK